MVPPCASTPLTTSRAAPFLAAMIRMTVLLPSAFACARSARSCFESPPPPFPVLPAKAVAPVRTTTANAASTSAPKARVETDLICSPLLCESRRAAPSPSERDRSRDVTHPQGQERGGAGVGRPQVLDSHAPGWPTFHPGSAKPLPLAVDRDEQRDDQDRDDIGDLDHRVDRGAGGVLVGVADGVAGDGRCMGLGALAAVGPVLDQLLRVVPGAAAGGHRDREEE